MPKVIISTAALRAIESAATNELQQTALPAAGGGTGWRLGDRPRAIDP